VVHIVLFLLKMAESSQSRSNQVRKLVSDQVVLEDQLDIDLLARLNHVLASTENNIVQNRRMLAEIEHCLPSEEKKMAEDSLTDLLAQNIRTKNKLQASIEYMERRMADKAYEFRRFSRF
jgi:hypothetical protein